MSETELHDGIRGMMPRNAMSVGARKLRDFYEKKPGAPIYQCEFGYYSLERWKSEGFIDDATKLDVLFGFDEAGSHSLGGLGWCEAAFFPGFEEKVIEARGEHEVAQDVAGRHVLYFKGRRDGFMPEYLEHPVKDMKTWEQNCRWRLDPSSPERYRDLEQRMESAKESAGKGCIICLNVIGGYMYLRSLIGPMDTLYKIHDAPELIHACMETWLALAEAVSTRYQRSVTIDEVFLAEDICYNHGPLISPDAMKEFLFPYYRQLIANVKSRNLDRRRHLYVQIDTDGFSDPVIPYYRELGMDYLSPFEVAAGCDVVRAGRQYPDLLIRGGFDKRVLAKGKEAIDREVERILPVMKQRGGYIPTCDHGVPAEVSFEDYRHFRKRILEYAT